MPDRARGADQDIKTYIRATAPWPTASPTPRPGLPGPDYAAECKVVASLSLPT